jgi:hypothetical protein
MVIVAKPERVEIRVEWSGARTDAVIWQGAVVLVLLLLAFDDLESEAARFLAHVHSRGVLVLGDHPSVVLEPSCVRELSKVSRVETVYAGTRE